MNQFIEFQEREFEVLYVWDDILKKGFPITNDIKVLDLAKLTHDDRQVLAIGNDEEVSNLVAARGSTLAFQLKLSTEILGIVLQEIYHDLRSPKKLGSRLHCYLSATSTIHQNFKNMINDSQNQGTK